MTLEPRWVRQTRGGLLRAPPQQPPAAAGSSALQRQGEGAQARVAEVEAAPGDGAEDHGEEDVAESVAHARVDVDSAPPR